MTTNPPPPPDPRSADREKTSAAPDRPMPPSTPRWVKLFGIVTIVVIVLVVLAMLLGGNHGPGRHMGGASRDHPVLSSAGGPRAW